MHVRGVRHGRVEFLQFAQQASAFPLTAIAIASSASASLRRKRRCQLDQPLAVTGEFVARFDLRFLFDRQISRRDLGRLVPQKIEFLFARGLGGLERGVLRLEHAEF